MDYTQPDPGLCLGLARPNIPAKGAVLDIGCGTGRNTCALARRFGNVIGYDSNPNVAAEAAQMLHDAGLSGTIHAENVLNVQFEPGTIKAVSIGTLSYWPKHIVDEFVEKIWTACKTGAIINMDVALTDDGTINSDWIQFGSYEDPDRTGSFIHHCGSMLCENDYLGYLGGSYWTVDEFMQLLESLGTFVVVHQKTYQWDQMVEGGTVPRSIFVITIQKEN